MNKVCSVSPELEVIVGQPTMPRTEVLTFIYLDVGKFYFLLIIIKTIVTRNLLIVLADCEATLGIYKKE